MKKNNQSGYSFIEVLMTVVIIGFVATIIMISMRSSIEKAKLARASAEMDSIAKAAQIYFDEKGDFPREEVGASDDFKEFLEPSQWPDGPWAGSYYDWDRYEVDGEEVLQVSLRFCNSGVEDCNYPKLEIADDFDKLSSIYYCLEGPCRAHDGVDESYPGYCVNCQ